MNDIAKIEPRLVIDTLKRWKKTNKGQDLDYIISHGTRTLIKLGDSQTLEFLGYSSNPKVEVKNINIKNEVVKIGDYLEFEFIINPSLIPPCQGRSSYKEKLIIDYKIYFVGKNGKLLPKVFKIKKLDFTKSTTIIKKHPLKLMTTKVLYPGMHLVEIIINGNNYAKKKFYLI